MNKPLFNDYGVLDDSRFDINQIATLARDIFQKALDEGCTPVEIRALESDISGEVACAMSGVILRNASRLRKIKDEETKKKFEQMKMSKDICGND